MRSAGCIINDIVDKDFDKKVEILQYGIEEAAKFTTDF